MLVPFPPVRFNALYQNTRLGSTVLMTGREDDELEPTLVGLEDVGELVALVALRLLEVGELGELVVLDVALDELVPPLDEEEVVALGLLDVPVLLLLDVVPRELMVPKYHCCVPSPVHVCSVTVALSVVAMHVPHDVLNVLDTALYVNPVDAVAGDVSSDDAEPVCPNRCPTEQFAGKTGRAMKRYCEGVLSFIQNRVVLE